MSRGRTDGRTCRPMVGQDRRRPRTPLHHSRKLNQQTTLRLSESLAALDAVGAPARHTCRRPMIVRGDSLSTGEASPLFAATTAHVSRGAESSGTRRSSGSGSNLTFDTTTRRWSAPLTTPHSRRGALASCAELRTATGNAGHRQAATPSRARTVSGLPEQPMQLRFITRRPLRLDRFPLHTREQGAVHSRSEAASAETVTTNQIFRSEHAVAQSDRSHLQRHFALTSGRKTAFVSLAVRR